jgi:hypothetical protein
LADLHPHFWTVLGPSTATLAVALVIVGGVGKLALDPKQAQLDTEQKSIDRIDLTMAPLLAVAAQHENDLRRFDAIEKRLDSKLTIEVFDAYQHTSAEKVDALKADMLRTVEEVTHQVHTLEAEIVTRPENEAHWAEVAARIAEIASRLDALSVRINALSPQK